MDISTEELVDITDESVLSVKEGEGQTKKRLLRRMVITDAFEWKVLLHFPAPITSPKCLSSHLRRQ